MRVSCLTVDCWLLNQSAVDYSAAIAIIFLAVCGGILMLRRYK